MPRAVGQLKSNNVITGDVNEKVKATGKGHRDGPSENKTCLNPNGKENATKPAGRIHLAGPSQTKTLVNPNGKEPVNPKPAGKARSGIDSKNTESAPVDSKNTTGKGKTFSPGKNPNKVVEKQEPPVWGRGAFVDPADPNTIQKKVIDRPLMFRGTGLHPRATTPGRAAPRFARSNTNVPFWQGDIATTKKEEKVPTNTTESGIPISQRNNAKLKATEKFKPKQVGLFFVKETANQNNNNKSLARNNTSAKQPGTDDLFTPEKVSFTDNNNDTAREVDCLSGSRRGGPPAELKSLSRACLRVGSAVPDDAVSVHRHYGKKLNEKSSGSPRSTREHEHHGKKPFPERVNTSCSARANDIGSPARTKQEHSPGTILANKRFENTRRYKSNLHSGLAVNDAAPAQDVSYDHGKKRSELQNSRKSLQYVFEAPKKEVNSTYRPTAPWATD